MSQKRHTPEQIINKLQEAQVLVEEYVYVSANYPIGPSAAGHDNIDVCEMVTSLARFRGIQCGVQYAEGFRERRAYLRGRPNRLRP